MDVRECPDCGLFQPLPALRPGYAAHCLRCNAVLRKRRRDSFTVTIALMMTGLALFSVTLYAPLIGMQFVGRQQETTLTSLPLAFEPFGMWELAAAVLLFTMLAPFGKLALTGGVLVGLRTGVETWILAAMARARSWVHPWAMTEVFLLGVFVAYTRLTVYASVLVGPSIYAMGALMLVMVASDAWFDEHAMWEAIGRRRGVHPERGGAGPLIGCDTCGQVVHGQVGDPCPRCDSWLRLRKPDPILRTWALLLSAAALYVPANILPVMSIVRLGRTETTTILGGVQELIAYQMWPLALIVFTASIAVPMIKLILLSYLLISTQRRSRAKLRQRAFLYRLVDAIGRWSMIDVFMISILTALVRMGFFASVIPGTGAVCFAGVVVLTMLASASFDPRLMWDVAEAEDHAEGAAALAGAGA